MSNYTTGILLIAAWSASGVITAPFVLRAMSAIDKQKLDKDSLILFAIYGPIPALYFLCGYALLVFDAFLAAVFWVLAVLIDKLTKLLRK